MGTTSAPSRATWLGYGLLLLTAVTWGGAWVTGRLGAHAMPPLTTTWGRFVIATLTLIPARLLLERGRKLRLTTADVLTLLAMSLSGIVGYTAVFMAGVAIAPASDGAIITPGLVGVLTMTMAALASGTLPRKREMSGAVLASIGIVLVGWSAFRAASATSDGARLIGDLYFIGAAGLWSTYTVLSRRLEGRVPAISVVLIASALGVVVLTPIMLLVDGPPDVAAWGAPGLLNVIYLGFFATGLGFVTYYLAIRTLGVNRVMPGLGLVPLFGVLGAALFLQETLTLPHALGGLLVIAGTVIPALGRRGSSRGNSTPPPPGRYTRKPL